MGGWVANEARHRYIIKGNATIEFTDGTQTMVIRGVKEDVEVLSETLSKSMDVGGPESTLMPESDYHRLQRTRSGWHAHDSKQRLSLGWVARPEWAWLVAGGTPFALSSGRADQLESRFLPNHEILKAPAE